ncbi:MAG: translocation/assembly module TamB domain-containing protein [Prevotella sp.]|nr:translocation/assembly module TamB domain-containing protein [Prevotella sp.]
MARGGAARRRQNPAHGNMNERWQRAKDLSRRTLRTALRWVGGIAAGILSLIILLAIALYLPPVQNFVVKQAARIASEQTGMTISVDRVRLAFPIDLSVEGVLVVKPDSSDFNSPDTIAAIDKVVVDVAMLPLFRGVVNVDELTIRRMQFDTADLVATAILRGRADELSLKSHGVNLIKSEADIDNVLLASAKVDIQLVDTVVEDTTETENLWKIRLAHLALTDTDITFRTANDSLVLNVCGASATANDGYFDLAASLYKVGDIALDIGEMHYDNPFAPQTAGLDFNHITLNSLALAADSLSYSGTDAFLRLTKGSFKEANGLELTRLCGTMAMDSTALYVQNLNLCTASSALTLDATMALSAFDEDNPGALSLSASAEIGRGDVLLFLADMPEAFIKAYPYQSLVVSAEADGTIKDLKLRSLSIEMPAVFSAKVSGGAGNLLDMNSLHADVDINLKTFNTDCLTSAFLTPDLQETINIPSGTTLAGNVIINGNTYQADLTLAEGGGTINVDAACTIPDLNFNTYPDIIYSATITASSFPASHFVKGIDIAPVSLELRADGAGTDIFDSRTRLSLAAELRRVSLEGFELDGSTAEASVANGVAELTVNCVNDIVSGTITLDALINSDDIKGTLACAIDDADLRALGACDVPLNTSLCAHIDLESDLGECHFVKGFIGDIILRDSADTYRTRDLELEAFTRPDSTLLQLASGDLDLLLTMQGGYKTASSLGTTLTDELTREIERKYISQDTLLSLLPLARFTLHSGQSNFLYGYMKRAGYAFRSINADIGISPETGVNGFAEIDSLSAFGMQLDTLRFVQQTRDDIFNYTLQAKNGPGNPDYNFNLLLDGSLFATGSNLRLRLFDENDNLGINLSLLASLEHGGIRVSLTDSVQTIGYEKLATNQHNYIFLNDDGRVYADLSLISEKGTGLAIYSDNDNTSALQDITLGIYNLDLAPVAAVIPYCPAVSGIMSGDFHVIQTADEFSLSSAIGVDSLVYEGIEMGNLASEFVYMPLDDGAHYLDALLEYNGQDVGALQGTYTPGENDDFLDASVTLNSIPLNLVDGFIPDMIIGLKGYAAGGLTVSGTLSDLKINGTLDLDSAYLVSIPYGIELAIDERPITIADSRILLDDFRLYSHNDQPLVINGEIDCTDIANMETNLRLTAENWLIIDAKEDSRRSEAYGKAYINLDALAAGPLATIKIIGSVDVLGATDVTYILKDSPLSTDNAMEGLVEFTDFSSGKELTVARPVVGGPYIDLRLSVAKDARVFVALNATKTNYLDMTGGGDLRMVYSDNDIRLTGRYTVEEGEMKYSLPVIPLKTFTIESGSYVEFTGEVMNPALSITATETTKANATVNGTSQTVTFNCGVEISQTLSNMGLAFIISAPENMTIDSELKAMAADERNKVAVTMLTTGMYLSDNNLSSFSMNSALSSFLQNEINNISNSALRTLDLSVGIDNTTDATGEDHTDYTFKFAKRLWNNRVRIIVGGKVSSDNASAESLFDNVAFEYRLDKNSYTNLRLFYDRSVYDYLEGYVGQYGVGVAWTRQLQNFKELFRKNNKEETEVETEEEER